MCASTTSSSSRVGLDGQIKRGFPHELKMTETNPMPSVSMSASLPLTLIEQVQKGLYQATDWRERGGPELFFSPDSDAPTPSFTFTFTKHMVQEVMIIKVTLISVQLLLLLLLLLLLPSLFSQPDPTSDLCLLACLLACLFAC